jgi:hypothetical protein
MAIPAVQKLGFAMCKIFWHWLADYFLLLSNARKYKVISMATYTNMTLPSTFKSILENNGTTAVGTKFTPVVQLCLISAMVT